MILRILFLVTIGCYLIIHTKVFELKEHEFIKPSETIATWNIAPDTLKLLSGEFSGVISTLITLELGAYLGEELVRKSDGNYMLVKKNYDWEFVERLIRLTVGLDDKFLQVYIISQGHLPWWGGEVDVQNEILDIGIKARYWDWQLMQFKAFNQYYFLNDYKSAGESLIQAGKRPNAPEFLPILGARLASKDGDVKGAIVLLKSMLMNKKIDDPDYKNIHDRLLALQGIEKITVAIDRYKIIKGTIPESLKKLIEDGLLSELPDNPYGDYCLGISGKVFFDEIGCE